MALVLAVAAVTGTTAAGTVGQSAVVCLLFVLAVVALAVRGSAREVSVFAVAALASSVLLGVLRPGTTGQGWTGVVYALLFATAAVLAHGAVHLIRLQREFRRRGWELTALERRQRDRDIADAVSRERVRMAAEVHDRLGHRLTLLGVGLSGLEVDRTLSPQHRHTVGRLREALADATEEIGETVSVLRRENGDEVRPGPWDVSLSHIVQVARDRGVTVETDLPEEIEGPVSDPARAALARVVTEGLTNAAKHASGAPVTVALLRQGADVELRVETPRTGPVEAPGARSGLIGLAERLDLLGGALTIERSDPFVITARLPVDAHPVVGAPHRAVDSGGGDEDRWRRESAGTCRWMIGSVAACVGVATIVLGGFFTYAGLTAVIPPQTVERLHPGMPVAQLDELLPGVQMLDAPRARLPEPDGATCRYYESRVSFFERVDVHRLCVRDDRLMSVDTIPPG